MNKKILVIIIAAVFFIKSRGSAYANTSVVSQSAVLKTKNSQTEIDFRIDTLANFFQKYNSPLVPYASTFIQYADEYQIDYRLVPSIAGVESTFGKRIPYGSYNAYGWANGKYYFESWEDSIMTVSKTLREKYYDNGAENIDQIARRYAPPSNSWSWKVKYFMDKIDPFPVEFDL
jgi:hypothetical protein